MPSRAFTDPSTSRRRAPGQVTQNVASFIPQTLLSPGNALRNGIAYGVVPGLVSEGAGQAGSLVGPKTETAARIAGGVLGAGVGHLGAGSTPVDALLSGSTRGVTDEQMQAASTLQRAAAAQGIQLTAAEAIQQASGGRSSLGNVQRNLEGMHQSAPLMADFFAPRPQQTQQAANRLFGQVGPLTDQPSMIGTNAQQEATGAIGQVQGTINNATRPLYDAARAQTIPPEQFAPIANDPAFANSVQRLRAHPVLGPAYADLPDNSIGVIDAATKDMNAQGAALRNSANAGYNPEAAAAYTTGAGRAREIARTPALGGSAAYDQALQTQAAARQQYLQPIQAGPLGQIADTSGTLQQANALYPSNPLGGSQGEVAQAVRMLPQTGPLLTRQHLQTGFNEATQDNLPGPNQWGGPKFAATIAGNPQQAQNLEAGIGAGRRCDEPVRFVRALVRPPGRYEALATADFIGWAAGGRR